MTGAQFNREIVLEIARCHARAAFRELVRELEADGAEDRIPAKGEPGKACPSIHTNRQQEDQQREKHIRNT